MLIRHFESAGVKRFSGIFLSFLLTLSLLSLFAVAAQGEEEGEQPVTMAVNAADGSSPTYTDGAADADSAAYTGTASQADGATYSTVAENTYTIETPEDLIALGEICADPSQSVGITVLLMNDIDLTGKAFTPISCFCGTFSGQQHTISGLSVTSEGSRVGLFAVLTAEAVVSELRVTGSVASTDDGIAGGIAGENAGTIHNCIFQGSVSSPYSAGGIAGINFESGTVSASKVSGTVTGKLCAGGITGDNRGRVSDCQNYSKVSNGVSALTSFLKPGLLKGGICGTSDGIVENSEDLSSSVPSSGVSSPSATASSGSSASASGLFPLEIDHSVLILIGCALLALNCIAACIALLLCRNSRRYR